MRLSHGLPQPLQLALLAPMASPHQRAVVVLARRRRMLGADLGVEPVDVALRIAPIETHRGPTWQVGIKRRRCKPVTWRMPHHVEHGVAGCWLIAGLFQEGEELLARHIELAEREGLEGHRVLRAFRVETTALRWWAAHGELPGGDADHHRTLRTLLKFAFLLVEGETCHGPSAGNGCDHKKSYERSANESHPLRSNSSRGTMTSA